MNSQHNKKFSFNFNDNYFRYTISKEELEDIFLIDTKGTQIQYTLLKEARCSKNENLLSKGLLTKKRIDVTNLVTIKHTKTGNVLLLNIPECTDCQFKS